MPTEYWDIYRLRLMNPDSDPETISNILEHSNENLKYFLKNPAKDLILLTNPEIRLQIYNNYIFTREAMPLLEDKRIILNHVTQANTYNFIKCSTDTSMLHDWKKADKQLLIEYVLIALDMSTNEQSLLIIKALESILNENRNNFDRYIDIYPDTQSNIKTKLRQLLNH